MSKSKGKEAESIVSSENQQLYWEGRACVFKVAELHAVGPTTGYPAKQVGQSDFGGTLKGGQAVWIEVKENRGRLTKEQLVFLANMAQFGALALVYRLKDGSRFVEQIDERGSVSAKTELKDGETWLDAI